MRGLHPNNMRIDIMHMGLADYDEVAHPWRNTGRIRPYGFEDSHERIRRGDLTFMQFLTDMGGNSGD